MPNIIEERICRICKSKTTGKNYNGKPLWYIYKDDGKYEHDDLTYEDLTYVCNKCYSLKRNYGTYDINKIECIKKQKSIDKFKSRKCCNCQSKESKGSWYKKYNGQFWDGISYLCHRCGVYQDYSSTLKKIANHRTGNLSRYTQVGKGYIGVQIVSRTLGLKDCNIIMNNFCYYVDLSKHTKYGYVEVKIATYNEYQGRWVFNKIMPDKCDTIILLCMDKYSPWKNIERVYIIPSKDIIHLSSTAITKNPARSTWYDNPKNGYVTDIKTFNDNFHAMDIKNCTVLIYNEK